MAITRKMSLDSCTIAVTNETVRARQVKLGTYIDYKRRYTLCKMYYLQINKYEYSLYVKL
jgi:hypothetical protein